jgi:hypothetical protein
MIEVTAESIATGQHVELARMTLGTRGIVFARLEDDKFGLVIVGLDRAGHVIRVFGVTRLRPHEVDGFATVVGQAVHAYAEGK